MHPSFPDAPSSPFFEAVPHFPGINIPTLEVVAVGTVVVAGALAAGTITRSRHDTEKSAEEQPQK
jgi:hypothetical protein